MVRSRRTPTHVWVSTALALSCPALQAAEALSLPEVSVNAEKVPRSLDAVPASVKVIDGQTLEDEHITGFEQLEGRVPGLSFQPFGQSGINSPVMRGLTANFNALSTSTLMLVDDVPTLTAQGFENRFIDIDRIEVLRGPQSTLYGRNAEAGVIAVYSKPMDELARASVSAEAGSRDKRATRFALSSPLVDERLFGSVSGEWQRQDGFIRNDALGKQADDRERYNLNAGLRLVPQEGTDMVLRYARQAYDDDASLWGAPTARRNHVASGTDSWNRSWGQTLSLNIGHSLGDDLNLRSITAYNDFHDRIQQDTDFLPVNLSMIARDLRLRTLSQELRLEGQWGLADWLAGVYADSSENDLRNVSQRGPFVQELRLDQSSRTLAAFSHWNLHLTPDWTLSLGGRVERYRVGIDPRGDANQSRSWSSFSPKVALQYAFAEQNQVYLSASKGVRNGGFNVLSAATHYAAFEPEKVWSYELGIKGRTLEERLRYSLAAYYMDVTDMQVMQMPSPGVQYITSAASATSKGLDLDAEYLLSARWSVQTGLAWNRTRFDSFQDGRARYDGHHNPFAPDLTGYLGLRYDDPEGWYVQGNLVGSDKVYLDAANQYTRNGYALVNLSAGVRYEQWELSGYVNNLADREYDAVGYQNGFITVYSPPRELGVRVTWKL